MAKPAFIILETDVVAHLAGRPPEERLRNRTPQLLEHPCRLCSCGSRFVLAALAGHLVAPDCGCHEAVS